MPEGPNATLHATPWPTPTTSPPPDPLDSPVGRFLRDPGGFLGELARDLAGHAAGLAHRYGPPLLVGLLLAAAAVALLRRWRAERLARQARWVDVLAPPEADLDGAGQLWSALADALRPRGLVALLAGRPHVAFELLWAERGALRVGIWVPGPVPPGVVERAAEGAWPGSSTRTTDPPAPVGHAGLAAGGRLRLRGPEWFPLRAAFANDPLRALVAAGGDLRGGETAVVAVLARPAHARRLRAVQRAARMLRTGRSVTRAGRLLDLARPGPAANPARYAHDPSVAKDVQAILAKLAARPCWEAEVRYAVAAPAPAPDAPWRARWQARGRLRGRAHTLASSLGVYTDRNDLRRRRLARPAAALAARRLGRGDLLSLPELVALAHLPVDAAIPGLTRAGARAVAPRPEVPARGKVLGDADAGEPRPVALAVPDARYHLHVMGATGSGKSTLLANLVLDDVAAGRGAVVVDPKGDLVRDLLDRLPAQTAERLVLLDPDEATAPPSLNVLDGPDPDLAVDHLVGIFRAVFAASWGPRTDDILRAACLTLLRHGDRDATLAEVPRLLTDAGWRQQATSGIGGDLGRFWTWYEQLGTAAQAAMTGPALSRLRAFLLRPFVRQTVGSAASSFDLGGVLDGGLLLARLPKGQLGGETARLLGSFVVAKTWQAVLHRATAGQAARADASLVVDECHNFLTLPVGFEELFAEARGYRLSLVLAHQHLAQLPRELREAISANARTKLWFTTSPEDARALERHVAPELGGHDLAHLGAYQAAARLVVDGRELPACTVRTRPAPAAIPGRAGQLRAAASRHAGRSASQRQQRDLAKTPDAPGRRGFHPTDLHPHGHQHPGTTTRNQPDLHPRHPRRDRA